MEICHSYRGPALRNFVVQVVVVFFSAMMLDGGVLLHVSLISVVGYWASVCMIILKSPQAPTRGDLVWVRVGFAVTFVLALVIGGLVMNS